MRIRRDVDVCLDTGVIIDESSSCQSDVTPAPSQPPAAAAAAAAAAVASMMLRITVPAPADYLYIG